MTQPQLPPRVVLTCPADASHKLRTRQPPGSVLLCTACGQQGRHGVTVTVPAPLPAVRAPLPASPEGLAVISRRKTAPERWYCSSCRGSAATPGPGEPVPGWLELRADSELLARACTEECLAKVLPEVQQRLAGRPWVAPEPPSCEGMTGAAPQPGQLVAAGPEWGRVSDPKDDAPPVWDWRGIARWYAQGVPRL